jgi:hypothetical protein
MAKRIHLAEGWIRMFKRPAKFAIVSFYMKKTTKYWIRVADIEFWKQGVLEDCDSIQTIGQRYGKDAPANYGTL